MGMIAICSPQPDFALMRSRQRSSKAELEQPDFVACHIFASAGPRLPNSPSKARAILVEHFAEDATLIGTLREQVRSRGRVYSRVRAGKASMAPNSPTISPWLR